MTFLDDFMLRIISTKTRDVLLDNILAVSKFNLLLALCFMMWSWSPFIYSTLLTLLVEEEEVFVLHDFEIDIGYHMILVWVNHSFWSYSIFDSGSCYIVYIYWVSLVCKILEIKCLSCIFSNGLKRRFQKRDRLTLFSRHSHQTHFDHSVIIMLWFHSLYWKIILTRRLSAWRR